jgi:hypothetical protein
VEGDPVNRIDPGGLDWWDADTSTLHGSLANSGASGGSVETEGGRVGRFREVSKEILRSEILEEWRLRWAEDFERINAQMQAQLAEGLAQLAAECYAAFASKGMSNAELVSQSLGVRFYDTSTSHQQLTGHQILKNGDFRQLRDIGWGEANAFVMYQKEGRIGNAIVLRANFYGGEVARPRIDQNRTLVHELLHGAFNMGDGKLRDHLSIPDSLGPNDSVAITRWLERGCPK